MMEWFRCPDDVIHPIKDCLTKCRMAERCLTLPTLTLISEERVWSGKASTTQLLNGTMLEFLKLTQPYVVDPDKRAFLIAGIKHHANLDEVAKAINLPSEVALSIDRDIFDLLEPEVGMWTLTDYKLWGSYKIARVLGIVEVGKKPDPTGAVYKSSGKWGKAGEPKMVPVFMQIAGEADNWETELQLNRYSIMLEERGIQIGKMQVQATVRDGNTSIAISRGVVRNIYKIPVRRLSTQFVLDYFKAKEQDLAMALSTNHWDIPCNAKECWDGVRCRDYCEVARNCPKGLLYINKEAE